MKTIEIKQKLVEEALDQLKAAQQDSYVQSTQNVIDELELALHQPPVISQREHEEYVKTEKWFAWRPIKRSLISKKVIWKGKEYTFVDKHNDSDFVMIDDENNSVIGLHWNDVELVD